MNDSEPTTPEAAADGARHFMDRDGDRLDDRLVAPSDADADSVSTVVRRVQKLTLRNLPRPILERLVSGVEEHRERMLRSVKGIERELHEALFEGRPDRVDACRRRIRQLGRDHDNLQGQLGRLRDALEHRIVRDGMTATLGTEGRVRALEFLVIGLILLVVPLLAADLLIADLSEDTRNAIEIFDIGCCAVFLAEFFMRLRAARDKGWFWRNHWIDFVTSIPLPSFVFARFGRTLRLLRLLRLLRVVVGVRRVLSVWQGLEKFEDLLSVRLMTKSLKWGVGIMLFGAWLIHVAEGGAGPHVDTLGEGLWWSFTTVVTGGFGDIYNPTSFGGKMLTVLLVVSGMIVVGVFTATLTSLYMGEESEAIALRQEGFERDFEALMTRIETGRVEQEALLDEMRNEIAELRRRVDG